VPVERIVGIGLVRPRTERPVSGVWSSSLSRPVPPSRALVRFTERRWAAFLAPPLTPVVFLAPPRFAVADLPDVFAVFPVFGAAAFLTLPRRGGLLAFLRFALPCGVLAPAVFRFPPAVLLFARAPAPDWRFDGVVFCPLLFTLFFLAIDSPFSVVAGSGPRVGELDAPAEIDFVRV
jgi:hypothetical protein